MISGDVQVDETKQYILRRKEDKGQNANEDLQGKRN